MEFAPTILESNIKKSNKRSKTNHVNNSNSYADIAKRSTNTETLTTPSSKKSKTITKGISDQQGTVNGEMKSEIDLLKANQQDLILQMSHMKSCISNNAKELQKTNEQMVIMKQEVTKTVTDLQEETNNNIKELRTISDTNKDSFDSMMEIMIAIKNKVLGDDNNKENAQRGKIQRTDGLNTDPMKIDGGNPNAYTQGAVMGSLPRL